MNTLWEHLPFGPGENLPFYDFGDANYAVARWEASGTEFLMWDLASGRREPLQWSDPLPLAKASSILVKLLASPVSLPNAVVIFNVASAESVRIGFCRTAAEIENVAPPSWYVNPKGGLGSFRKFIPRIPVPTRYERVMENEDDE